MDFLKGMKTKIMAGLAIITGLVGVFSGDQTIMQFFGNAQESITILWAGATAWFMRLGMQK